MPLKVVIVGCGQIAEAHITEIKKLKSAYTAGVCDLEMLMAEQLSRRFGILHYYDSYDKMLETEKPDVVHITTPPQSHLPLAEQALEAGCHIYVEKPLAMNYEDSAKLLTMADERGKKLTIGYTYLFDPPANTMRAMIKKGVIGDPVHIDSYYGYNLAGPFGTAILGSNKHWVHLLPGKLFHNNIDHLLYKITEFIDDDEPFVSAFGYKQSDAVYGDVRDSMMDELRVFIKGKDVSAYGTFCSKARPASQLLKVYGTKATISLDYGARTVILDTPNRVPSALGRLLPSFGHGCQYFKCGFKNVYRFMRSDFHFFAGFNKLLGLFYDSILNDGPPPIDYGNILRINAIMDEIFKQLNQSGNSR